MGRTPRCCRPSLGAHPVSMADSHGSPPPGAPPSAAETRLPQELHQKQQALLDWLSAWGRVAVTLSGGVDSSVVAAAAVRACGERAVGVTADSPSLASGELQAAQDLARRIGLRHVVLPTHEFDDPRYAANPSNRCFYCKSELYAQLIARRTDLGFDVVVNGANVDDRGDHRPGMVAAGDYGVRSPLLELGFTKADVRELARHWSLPVWDKPAAPCLSSRIAYGVAVTPERVRRIDLAESWLKDRLSVRELRVRLESNDLARIEVPLDALPRLVEPALRDALVEQFRAWGFRAVALDLEGFRSGSLNAALPAGDLVRLEL